MRDHEVDFANANLVSVVVNEDGEVGGQSHEEVFALMMDSDKFDTNQISVALSSDVEQAKRLVDIDLFNQSLVLRNRSLRLVATQFYNRKHLPMVLCLEDCDLRVAVLFIQGIMNWLRWPDVLDVVNTHICGRVIHHDQRLHILS